MRAKQKKQLRNFLIFAVIALCIGLGAYYALNPGAIFPGQPSTVKTTSTFTLTSAVDGEDVSDFCEISVWVPKSGATFDDTEDIYTLTNFEEEKSSMDADDVSIDLRDYSYVWVEIDPDREQVFGNNFYFISGGTNYDYTLKAHDLTTDVNFNVVDEDTMAAITVGDLAMSGGYVAILDCPHNTTTAAQLHVGTNWDMEQSEFDDLSTTQKAFYYDEKNFAGQYPFYDPAVDLEKEYHSDLEKITDAFCLKFDFNGTISTVDGEANQVNVTVAADHNVEVVISGDLIYFIWYEGFDFESGAYSIYFDMATNPVATTGSVHLDDVDSGRIIVPRDDDALGSFTKYSDIAA